MRVTLSGRERPVLLVVAADTNATTLQELFARRGFAVVVAPSLVALERYLALGGCMPEAAVLDFTHEDAAVALTVLVGLEKPPVLVGVAADERTLHAHPSLDAGFAAPVDRARLFVRMVELVVARYQQGVTLAADWTGEYALTTMTVSLQPGHPRADRGRHGGRIVGPQAKASIVASNAQVMIVG